MEEKKGENERKKSTKELLVWKKISLDAKHDYFVV